MLATQRTRHRRERTIHPQVPGMKNSSHPHLPEDVQHGGPILAMHGAAGHDDGLHDPPPVPELGVLGAAQAPPLQTWPDAVQSVQS
jgi:hypothetical protein